MSAQLTREQGAILTLFTGIICGPVEDAVDLAARIVGRPLEASDLGDEDLATDLRALVRPVFEAIAPDLSLPPPMWPAPATPEESS